MPFVVVSDLLKITFICHWIISSGKWKLLHVVNHTERSVTARNVLSIVRRIGTDSVVKYNTEKAAAVVHERLYAYKSRIVVLQQPLVVAKCKILDHVFADVQLLCKILSLKGGLIKNSNCKHFQK